MSKIKPLTTEYNSQMLSKIFCQLGNMPIGNMPMGYIGRDITSSESMLSQVYDVLNTSSVYVDENGLMQTRKVSPYTQPRVVGKIKL